MHSSIRKSILYVATIVLCSVLCKAQNTYIAILPTTFTSVTTSRSVNLIGSAVIYHAINWQVQGSPASCSVQVDSSADGVTWNSGDVIASQTCTSNGSATSNAFTANFLRVNVTALSANTSLTVVWTGYDANPDGVGNCTISADKNSLSCPNIFVGPGTPNSASGTTNGLYAKFINTGGVAQLQTCGLTDNALFCFQVVKGGGNTGNAWVSGAYTEAATFDNTAVNNDWVVASFTGDGAGAPTAGQVHDTGVSITSPCPSGSQCIGYAVTPGTGSQTIVKLAQQAIPLTTIQNGGVAVTPTSGAVNLVAGSGITLTTSGNGVTVANTGTVYIVHRSGVQNANNDGTATFQNLCGSLTFPSGTLSAGDLIYFDSEILFYGGTGTPGAVKIGVAVTGATGSPYYGTVGTPTANNTNANDLRGKIAIIDTTHIAISYIAVNAGGGTVSTNGAGASAGQVPTSGTTTGTVTVSDISSNPLVITPGGFISGTVGTAQSNRCIAASAQVIK